jgi:hypothetical protein
MLFPLNFYGRKIYDNSTYYVNFPLIYSLWNHFTA